MPTDHQPTTNAPRFTILVDGRCHLCAREAALMQRMDRGRGRLGIVDITAPEFNPAEYRTTMDRVMGEIHGVTENGQLITGVEVFRQAYAAIGWGWLLNWTRLPLIRQCTDLAYRGFARLRLRLPRMKSGPSCSNGRCKLPSRSEIG
ncbi:MAG: thiol-disulfide oxidoreductase DCC family protein [Phycisphaerales bacterium JB065]